MREGRWTTVTESEFDHERRGLEAIRAQLPDAEPWRAWSNFTFTAHTGHVREVDLLVVAPERRLHGRAEGLARLGRQRERHLGTDRPPAAAASRTATRCIWSNKKAKELAGLLRQQLSSQQRRQGVWVGEAVCFTDSSLRIRLPAHEQNGVYTVAGLVGMLKRAPQDERRRITPRAPEGSRPPWGASASAAAMPSTRSAHICWTARPSTPVRPGRTTWHATTSCPSGPASGSTCASAARTRTCGSPWSAPHAARPRYSSASGTRASSSSSSTTPRGTRPAPP